MVVESTEKETQTDEESGTWLGYCPVVYVGVITVCVCERGVGTRGR